MSDEGIGDGIEKYGNIWASWTSIALLVFGTIIAGTGLFFALTTPERAGD